MRSFFRNWYAVTITAAVLLAALFAFGLPLFVAFFRPIPVRIAAVLLVALAWGLWWFLRHRAARKAADAIAAELAGPNAADEEGKALLAHKAAQLTATPGELELLLQQYQPARSGWVIC